MNKRMVLLVALFIGSSSLLKAEKNIAGVDSMINRMPNDVFKEYLSTFKKIELPFYVDSMALFNLYEHNTFENLTDTELVFFNIPEYLIECAQTPQQPYYLIKKIGYLAKSGDNQHYLLYCVSQTDSCPYDSYEFYIVLCQYNNSAEIVKYKTIGMFVQFFLQTTCQYFSINEETGKLQIKERLFEENSNDENPDISTVNISENEFYW